jgi:hypothetical protein
MTNQYAKRNQTEQKFNINREGPPKLLTGLLPREAVIRLLQPDLEGLWQYVFAKTARFEVLGPEDVQLLSMVTYGSTLDISIIDFPGSGA